MYNRLEVDQRFIFFYGIWSAVAGCLAVWVKWLMITMKSALWGIMGTFSLQEVLRRTLTVAWVEGHNMRATKQISQ